MGSPQETTYRPVHESEDPAGPPAPGPAAPEDRKRSGPDQPKTGAVPRMATLLAKETRRDDTNTRESGTDGKRSSGTAAVTDPDAGIMIGSCVRCAMAMARAIKAKSLLTTHPRSAG